MVVSLVLPRIIHIGAGARGQLPFVLKQLEIIRPLVVSDHSLVEHHLLDDIFTLLDSNGIAYDVFDFVAPDPTTTHVNALRLALEAGNYDCPIAIGGGSPMDTAKAAAAILNSHPDKNLRDLKAPFIVGEGKIPIVCLPTTAGTGSEMTRFAVITDTDTGEKMLISGTGCVPVAALVDVELSMSMPPRITADTGIDALTHGLEAYISRRHNDHADVLAVSGVRRVLKNLPLVQQDPQNVEARTQMMLGATHAGMAFSASSVALIHGMSRAIGALFHVPHGMANAMLLNAVLRWTRPHALARLASLARNVGVAEDTMNESQAADSLLKSIATLTAAMSVPTPKGFGIDSDEWTAAIPTMAQQALASGSPANNPGNPTNEDICGLYAEVWN